MSAMKSKLKERYDKICNDYLKAFCKKHSYEYNPSDWIGGEVGGIIEIADLFVSVQDMITDIEMNASEEQFVQWYDYCMDCHYAELPHCNYESWLKGCPRHDPKVLKQKSKEGQDKIFNTEPKDIDSIIGNNDKLNKLRNELQRLIDEYK